MNLSITAVQDSLSITGKCPTVVVPGEGIVVSLNFRAVSNLQILSLSWQTPTSVNLGVSSSSFPVSLNANQEYEFTQQFNSVMNEETFGELEAILRFRNGSSNSEMTLSWKHWISVFHRVTENDATGLSAESRQKLISAVNARLINGNLYMADFIRFFDHYLNIQVPEWLADRISKELSLTQEELPVDEETFHRIASGQLNYYGIEVFELIAEEECEESDDRFDPDENREVVHPEIEIS